MMGNKPTTQQDPTLLLQAAVDTLEKFATGNEQSAVPHVHHFDVIDGNLKTYNRSLLNKMRTFIGAVLSSDARKDIRQRKVRVQDKVLHSIDVVKSCYLLIEKFKQGNPKEQKLAESAVTAINRYNAIIGTTKKESSGWIKRLFRFLYEYFGLTVDNALRAHTIDLPLPAANSFNRKITQTFHSACYLPVPADVDVRLRDAFIIKSAKLLEIEGFSNNTGEALKIARQAPITASTDKTTKAATLLQTWSPLPGIRINVSCSTSQGSLLPQNCQISFQYVQTGFPHPSQHTGWALADQLIPPCPHRLDELKHLPELLKRKQMAAKALAPKGAMMARAISLLECKKQAFHHNTIELINRHRDLAMAILSASGEASSATETTVASFFDSLKHVEKPWEHLAEAHHAMADHFITRPHDSLQHTWLERTNPGLINNDPQVSYQTALEILDRQASKKLRPLTEIPRTTREYIICMGNIIKDAAHRITLQHLSEMMGFAPPMLSTFEQKLQTATYKQAEDFLSDLELVPSPEAAADRMRKLLDADCGIFAAESFDALEEITVEGMKEVASAAKIVNELEGYFNTRFLSRKTT